MFNINNPWLVAIVVGIILISLGYYIYDYRKQKTAKNIIMNSYAEANNLGKNELYQDALVLFLELLKSVSEDNDPYLWANIQNSAGVCYCKLSLLKDKQDNLLKAIHAFNQSLRVRKSNIYSVEYSETQNNLGNAYRLLSE